MGRPMVIIICCGMSEEMEMIQPGPEAAAGSELSELLRKRFLAPAVIFEKNLRNRPAVGTAIAYIFSGSG